MKIEQLAFSGVILITPKIFRDERGFFLETFSKSRYHEIGLCDFVQDNLSCSKYGTLRGMHFQSSPGQAKLISVSKGRIFDVFVDMRLESETFGKWSYIYLDDKERSQLFLPVGFAHGFCCISEEALVSYKVSSEYNPKTEKGFRFDDKEVGIEWPVQDPIVSDRDLKAPSFKESLCGCGV